MADRILNYIEFRYEDGSKQVLRGKDAQNWMDFNKEKLSLAKTIDKKPHVVNWKWERFGKGQLIPNRPGIVEGEPEPKPEIVTPKPKPKPKPKPSYSEYDNY